jgi:outer membrane protein assembly factor BamB
MICQVRTVVVALVAACLVAVSPVRAHAEESTAERAAGITDSSGIDRGVCVVVGGSPELAIELARQTKLLVHVLTEGPESAAKLAAEKAGFGIDRLVVERMAGTTLPHGDNVIDLVVLAESGAEVSEAEVLRALRPLGVAIGLPDRSNVIRKPEPKGLDDWSLWEHGPDNNPVSTDRMIRAPYMTQFMAEPYYIAMPSITTAAGGRTFLATGHIAHHRREWETINRLIARNGYNGTVLWERQLPDGFLSHRSAFVATDETFYLLDGDGCLALDAGTGEEKTRITIPDVDGQWKWMVLRDNVLYMLAGPKGGDAKVIKGDRVFGGWSWADLSQGYYGRPRVPWGFGNLLAAYDLEKEEVLWKHEEESLVDSRAMAMRDNRMFLYCPDKHVRCLSAESGEVLWTNPDKEVLGLIDEPGKGLVSTPGFRSACIAVAGPDTLIIQGQTRMNVVALSAADGYKLWSKKKFTNNPNVIFLDGKAVLGVGERGAHVAVDPVSGQVVEELKFHKAACTRLTASTDSLFVRGEGTLRYDLASKSFKIDGSVRPACNDGALPANGLLYLGPWACDCNLSLIGAVARCSAGAFDLNQEVSDATHLQVGDGSLDDVAELKVTDEDWPTYRGDNQRSGSTSKRTASPNQAEDAAPVPAWAYSPPRSMVPTPPIAVGRFVFTAGSDGYVRGLDAATGQVVWEYATSAPIKASPTVWQGRLYVGSGDGCVYALEAATGRLLWRFQAAPAERRIMVYGHLCSTWPVNTGVLVEDDTCYFAAGIIDLDGTYVYCLDAKTGKIKWQNTTCARLSPDLGKGVSAQGNMTILGDRLLMAGGNQVCPAEFDLATGECLNRPPTQGRPVANHGKFAGVFRDHALMGGRILYASPRNVANKDSFVVVKNGRPLTLNLGGIPPAWNDELLALIDSRSGRLACYGADDVAAQIEKGFPKTGNPAARRWQGLWSEIDAGAGARWKSDLNNPNKFEVLSLAMTPDRVVAVVQFQDWTRAHPQWQLAAFGKDDGTPIWFWRRDLPLEPLPGGLAIGRQGQVIVAALDGTVASFAPLKPGPPAGRGAVTDAAPKRPQPRSGRGAAKD